MSYFTRDRGLSVGFQSVSLRRKMRICPLDHELQETSYTRSKLDCDHPNRGKAYHAAICTLTCPQCDYDECLNEHVLATAGGPSDNRRSCNATSEAPQEATSKPPPTPQERIAVLEAENAKLQSTIKALRASGPRVSKTRQEDEADHAAPIYPHCGEQLTEKFLAEEQKKWDEADEKRRADLTREHVRTHLGGLLGKTPVLTMDHRSRAESALHARTNATSYRLCLGFMV